MPPKEVDTLTKDSDICRRFVAVSFMVMDILYTRPVGGRTGIGGEYSEVCRAMAQVFASQPSG